MIEPKEIFIAYALWHVDEACRQAKRGTTVVCLDFWVERELKKNNIPFISLRDFIDAETGAEEWLVLAQDVAREWYRLPAMKFFEYENIRIGEVVEPIMEVYLPRLFYYVRIFVALKKRYKDACFSIPAFIVEDAPTDGCLVNFERRAVIDAARMAGLRSTVLGKPVAPHKRPFLRTVWKSLLLRTYNILISLVPRLPAQAGRGLKIYASEYWSHIGPVIEKMDNTELVLMEVSELKHIPWRQLIKHRIRTRHPNDVIGGAERCAAARVSEKFMDQWRTAKKEVSAYFLILREELDWSPILEACEYLITYAPRVIADIDALRRIMEEEKPDVVVQLASVAGRHHYSLIMARIAEQLKIPSVELQHAGAGIDPRSAYSRIETEYLASFGAYTDEWYERMGNSRNRLIPTGSPRFDRYVNERAGASEKGKQLFKQLGLDINRPVLLAAVPFSDTSLYTFDSYQLAEFFETMHATETAIPGIQVLFKCRNNNHVGATREHLQELFHTDGVIAGNEDLFALLCESDAVICGNSTVIYQAMLSRNPLVLYPWQAFDTYHAQMYEPAAPLARTADEAIRVLARIFAEVSYREELLVRQEHFLEGFSLDGKSSKRVAVLLRDLPGMSQE